MRIAISTGGGDAPGLNAVIRAAVLSALDRGWDVLGIKRGYAGLLGEDEVIALNRETEKAIGLNRLHIMRTLDKVSASLAAGKSVTENQNRKRSQ